MADETTSAAPAAADAPETPAAPATPANPYAHTVEEPKTWEHLTLHTPLIEGGILTVHRPSLDEEMRLSYLIRKIARAREINPDDVNGATYDALYLAAFFSLCSDEPEALDYFSLTPKGRRQSEALHAVQMEVFAWLGLFRDDDADGGDD